MIKPVLTTIKELYGDEAFESQKYRYEKAMDKYKEHFGEPPCVRIFSAPGRTEIGGNHTDHNNGKVLAAAVSVDIIAMVETLEENKVVIKSDDLPEIVVMLDNLDIREDEKITSEALVRGIAKGFKDNGSKIGGFKAFFTSTVKTGSGLSSSAAFEILVGTIFNYIYNKGIISPVKVAQIAKYAENKYYGKPCGLMDQMASIHGGFVAIDFKDTELPIVEKIKVNFEEFGHSLCIIDTKESHSSLSEEYSAITEEMAQISNHFSVSSLRQICKQDIILNINVLRESFGDRAVLRALHYFEENDRVDKLAYALRTKDFHAFLESVNESGNSSYKYLQNIYKSGEIKNQAVGIGLNIAEYSLKRKGACRIHGGGFAGTIQAFVPADLIQEFKVDIERVFGANTCYFIHPRSIGACEITSQE